MMQNTGLWKETSVLPVVTSPHRPGSLLKGGDNLTGGGQADD